MKEIAHLSHGRIKQRQFNENAFSCLIAFQQRCENSTETQHAGANVHRRKADADAWPLRLTNGADHAGEGLQHDIVAGLPGQRSLEAEPGNLAIDQLIIQLLEGLIIDAELFRRSAFEALNNHVGLFHQ